MKVESEEQGVRFEWTGEPSTVVRVGFLGDRDQSYERLELLQSVVAGSRLGGVAWTDLEVRERLQRVDRVAAPVRLLLWSADFGDWQSAALAFTVLCRAVGLDDDGVELEVTP